jgi:Na+/H+ antiporter NhaD/arsenite permease-like protein
MFVGDALTSDNIPYKVISGILSFIFDNIPYKVISGIRSFVFDHPISC